MTTDHMPPHEAISAGLRRADEWPALQRTWPDAHAQLGELYDGLNDAVISIGAPGWTERAQLEHFTILRDSVNDLWLYLNHSPPTGRTPGDHHPHTLSRLPRRGVNRPHNPAP